MRRSLSATAALAAGCVCLAACASDPALMTRAERLEIARRGPAEFAASTKSDATPVSEAARRATGAAPLPGPGAPARRPVSQTAPPPRGGTGGNSRRADALAAEEQGVADAYWATRNFRDANTRLSAALAAYDRAPSSAREENARQALAAYQESARMSRMSAVVVALSLTGLAGCNTISSQISALNKEEQQIVERATAYQEHRKSIVALVAALEQLKRDGSAAKSERAVEEARARYEQTEDRL